MPAAGRGKNVTRRLTVRMHTETAETAAFLATRANGEGSKGISLNEYIVEAVEEKIARDCGHIPDVDNLVVNRINQLNDEVRSLSTTVDNLSSVAVNGFDSIIRMGRGDNFLLDMEATESGELNE